MIHFFVWIISCLFCGSVVYATWCRFQYAGLCAIWVVVLVFCLFLRDAKKFVNREDRDFVDFKKKFGRR